ncbi:hypothetical protein [Bacillus mobilis]|uniref:hypothetical protein n=1 Tax=Bacillus mobilis TaxID=2026190 RepID=UPI002E20ACDA|nr:hypothetical protein [Bacillus mobilis]MED0930249.1 hypothetical protein [Bacillus mobilis]MED0952929.1 hypothetical protein [Bacillus mobilis]
MLKRKITTGVLTLSLSLSLFAPSTFAAGVGSNEQKLSMIEDIKASYLDKKVQDRLIEKMNTGEIFDNVNPEKEHLGKKERLNETTTLTTYPDGSKEVSGIDLSEAKFFDESGNEVLSQKGAAYSISGGTTSSGSGYSCVKGAKVYRNKYQNFSVSYKADYCNHQGAYDKLSRVYGINIKAPGGDYSIEGSGVFRERENASYSAYGGVRFKYSQTGGGSSSQWLYIRVGNDKVWEDSNIVH